MFISLDVRWGRKEHLGALMSSWDSQVIEKYFMFVNGKIEGWSLLSGPLAEGHPLAQQGFPHTFLPPRAPTPPQYLLWRVRRTLRTMHRGTRGNIIPLSKQKCFGWWNHLLCTTSSSTHRVVSNSE